jgi:receptor-type tyrosine-protein phosphatase gamma
LQPKCDLYWPDAGSETYGDLVVSLLREDILASYTLRTFSIRPMRVASSKKNSLVSAQAAAASAERTVYQYHFTAWPDHGVPLHALPLVSFVRNSAAANTPDAGPIVVHCRYSLYFLLLDNNTHR